MTIVNSKEFEINQEQYLELAHNEQVFIPKDENMFVVTIANDKKKKYLEPDDDFRRAITFEEFRKGTHDIIHNFFANK